MYEFEIIFNSGKQILVLYLKISMLQLVNIKNEFKILCYILQTMINPVLFME